MKNFIISLIIMLITSISMSAQTNKYSYNSYMSFGNIPMSINKEGFKARMKVHGYKYKEENKNENMMLFRGKFIGNNDIIIAEYSSKYKRVGKVVVLTSLVNNIDNVIDIYTEKYGEPITNGTDTIYVLDEGQIIISFDNENIIITYIDDIAYQMIVNDNNYQIYNHI